MWVQEGSDCKDVDVEDESPLFSRFYHSRRKKQTTTIIGIPVRPKPKPKPKPTPKPKSTETKENNITTKTSKKVLTKSVKTPIVTPKKKATAVQDEKEMEVSETPDLKSIVVEKVSVPVSPAQFIENIGTKEEDEDVIFDNDDIIINDQQQKEEQQTEQEPQEEKGMFIDEFNDDDDDDIGDSDLDLTIIGKKLSYLFDAVPVFGDIVSNDNDTKMNIDGDGDDGDCDQDQKKLDFDEESKISYYIPQAFDGLYVNSLSDWDECINFSNCDNGGLLIVEIYSSMFGASNVMYTMIDEILNKKENDKIKFVRLNSEKINEIYTIKEIIKDYEFYLSITPIPMYIFIKNGDKVDFLKGTQPKEFEIIIDKHLSHRDQEIKENIKEEIFKYKPLEYSSHLSIMNNNKENESKNSNVENITNLIKKLDIDHQSNQTTKLSKKSRSTVMSRSTGISTQSMFS